MSDIDADVKLPLSSSQMFNQKLSLAVDPLSSLHSKVEIADRLKQVYAWQQQQQKSLLRLQQEQLARLRREQECLRQQVGCSPINRSSTSDASFSPSVASSDEALADKENFPPMLSESTHQANSAVVQLVPRVGSVMSSQTHETESLYSSASGTGAVQEICTDSALGTSDPPSSPREQRSLDDSTEEKEGGPTEAMAISSHSIHNDDRPLKPAVPFESSLEQLEEAQHGDYQQEESKTFVKFPFLKRGQGIARFGMKKFKLKLKKKTLKKERQPQASASSQPSLPASVSPAFSDAPLTPTVSQSVSAKSLSKTPQDSWETLNTGETLLEPLRESTPLLVRSYSNDSFLIRKDQFRQTEEDELREFEELEKVAELSLTTCSVDTKTTTTVAKVTTEHAAKFQHSPYQLAQACSPAVPSTTPVAAALSPGSEDLDETLKSDVQFHDEEAWTSFAQDSPPLPRSVGNESKTLFDDSKTLFDDSVHSTPSMLPLTRNHGPVHNVEEGFSLHGVSDTSHEATSVVLSTSASNFTSPAVRPPVFSGAMSCREGLVERVFSSQEQLPPPSLLVSKLFPALRKEREESLKALNTDNSATIQAPQALSRTKEALAPSDAELKQKLLQLETEIERFRKENSALEKLRREREQGLARLKQELLEFENQKREELTRFEEYKKEEIRKLKKDRKVFEAYQVEAKAARNKRDKEEIKALRNELQDLKEEFQGRESRWSATLARYRLRIEALEGQNRELQSDLRVMEQERLQSWQHKLEQRKQKTKSALKFLPGGAKKSHHSQLATAADKSPRREEARPTRRPQAAHLAAVSDSSGDEDIRRPSDPAKAEHEIPEIVDVRCKDTDTVEDSDSDLSLKAERIVNRVQQADRPKVLEKRRHDMKLQRPMERKERKTVKFSMKGAEEPSATLPPCNSPDLDKQCDLQIQETVQEDGSRVINFPNGTRKVMSCDGKSFTVYFFNGDVKEVKSDKTVVYFYVDSKTTHTTYTDGLEVFEFPNKQCEKHYPNGTKEILFPDKTVKYIYSNGGEECIFPDGSVQTFHPNGERTIKFANGQQEIHTREFKKREYPDGTVKTVYPDGRQETRYASGRLRIKDKDGTVLEDKLTMPS